jgi:Domain of unknown function (DUF4178)
MNTNTPAAKASYRDKLKCNQCDFTIDCVTTRHFEMFICPKCRKIQDKLGNQVYEKINIPELRKKPRIDIGFKGVYKGRSFNVIGNALKNEKSYYSSKWNELTLQYDDDGSIFYLSFWNGHYTFLEPIDVKQLSFSVKEYKHSIAFESDEFEFYSRYSYTTNYAFGAFTYDIVDVKKIVCYDYINPPYQLSIETDKDNNVIAFLGEYVTPKAASKIFNDANLAIYDREGVAPAQPFYGGLNVKWFNRIGISFIILFTLINIFIEGSVTPVTLLNKTFEFSDSSKIDNYISRSFVLDKQLTPYFIEFNGQCLVENNWVEVQMSLINENTGVEKELALGIEHYSGVDNGYSWSEGSYTSSAYLSSIDPGKYHLKVKIIQPDSFGSNHLDLEVKTSSPWDWNLLLLIIPFGIFIIIINILNRQFERMRSGEIDSLFEE